MRSAHDIRKLRLRAKKLLYSDLGQFVRLEYDVTSGGTLNTLYNVYEGQTITRTVRDDVRALKEVVDLNKIKLVNDARIQAGDALWLFDPTLNIADLPKLRIYHKIRSSSIAATGTAENAVMTVTGATYTVDQYKGWWLFREDGTFQIQSNTADTFTVSLDGQTMTGGAFEVMPATRWFPADDQSDIGDSLQHAYGESMLFQTLYCRRFPMTGKENQI
jgi:hypothetical protein